MEIIKKIYKWFTATKLRKILSSTLAVLIVLTSIRYIFLTPKVAYADSTLGFDEGYGTTVVDQNGTLSGTITNAVWKQEEFCKVGKCLYFDGTGDLVNFGNDSDVNFTTGSFTITGWFRTPDITSGTRVLVSKYNGATGTDGGYKVYMNSSGHIIFGIESDNVGFPEKTATANTAFDDNKWHHFTAVKNVSTSILIYIDGKLYESTGAAAVTTLTNTDNFYIGIDGDGTSNGFSGFLDEIKVYSTTARSAAEIKADFAGETSSRGTSASFGPDQSYLSSGLVGYWKMDESAANSCGTDDTCDYSGNSNNLAWVNDTTFSTGKYGNGTTFDGTGDNMSKASTPSLAVGTDNFTSSLWFKSSTVGGSLALVFSVGTITNDSVTPGYGIYCSDIFNCTFAINGPSTGDRDTLGYNAAAYFDNNWHQFTMVRNGQNMIYYIDGQEKTRGTDNNRNINTASLIVSHGTLSWNGQFDDFRIYNRALSPTEVQKLYSWAPGPVGHWKMDEGNWTNDCSTSTVFDSSGNGYNATSCPNSTGPTGGSNGKFGNAGSFNGSSQYVTTADNAFQSSRYTISMWIKPNQVTSRSIANVSESPGGSTHDRDFFFDSNSKIVARLWDSTSIIATSTTTAVVENWYYISATYDGSNLDLYINGVKEASTAAGNPYAGYTSPEFVLGQTNSNMSSETLSNTYYDGIIDNVMFYNYARTPGQIIEDMNGGHPAPGSPVGSALGHWRFDEGYGSSATDTIDQKTLTFSGNTWTNSGKYGKAVSFNGTDNRAYLNDNDEFDLRRQPFTATAWINKNTQSGSHRIIAQKGGSSTAVAGYWWSVKNNGTVDLYISDGTNYVVDNLNTTLTINDSVWHYVAFTWDPNVGAKMYVDGKLNASASATTTVDINSSQALNVGGFTSTGYTIDGEIDELKFYKTALTNDQILLDYNQGSMAVMGATSTDSSGNPTWSSQNEYCPPGQGSVCTPPVAEWKLDERTGPTAYDTSGNEYNGTLTAAPWDVGKFGPGLKTSNNAAREYFSVADPATEDLDFTNSEDYTLEAWVKLTAVENGTYLIAKNYTGDTNLAGYALMLSDSGGSQNPICSYSGGNGGGDDSTGTGSPLMFDGQWHHVVCVMDRDGSEIGTAGLFVFLDGTLENSNTSLAEPSAANSSALEIGEADAAAEMSNGGFDDIRIYNYARTPAQIAWDYNRGAPLAHWQMDESLWNGTADEVKDVSGNEIHGVRNGDANTASVGKINYAGLFDGTGDYVTIASPNLPTGDFTYTAWVNPDTVSSQQSIIMSAEDTSGTNELNIQITATGKLGAGVNGGSDDIQSVAGISASTWTHVAIRRSGSTFTIFINGVADSATGSDGTALNFGACSLMLGVDVDSEVSNCTSSPGQYFDGKIDDVRIFNYPLTAQQVKTVMNDGGALRFAQ